MSRLLLLFLLAWTTLSTQVTEARADEPNYEAMSVRELEDELDETSLGGPIAVLGVGGGIAIGGAIFTLYGAVFEAICVDPNEATYYSSGPSCGGKGLLIAGGAGLIVGATLATVGGVWLGSTIGKRRRIKRALERRSGEASSQIQFGVTPMASGHGLKMKMDF